jgi:hypothetical protein
VSDELKPIYQEESQGHPGMWMDTTHAVYVSISKGKFRGGQVRIVYAAPHHSAALASEARDETGLTRREWEEIERSEASEHSADLDAMRQTPGNCHKCGLPLSENPHPEAGKPPRYLEVGCPKECIPCMTLSRHNWATQAMKDARDADRYRCLRNCYSTRERMDVVDQCDGAMDDSLDAAIAKERAAIDAALQAKGQQRDA